MSLIITEKTENKCTFYLTHLRWDKMAANLADKIFECIFLNKDERILIQLSLKFVSTNPIHNKPALVQVLAWHRPGDKPLSERMLVSLLMHICVTQHQWVNDADSSIAVSHPYGY